MRKLNATKNPKPSATNGLYQPVAKVPRHSTDDSSRLTALLVGRVFPIFSLLAPCQPGDSSVSVLARLLPRAASRSASLRSEGWKPYRQAVDYLGATELLSVLHSVERWNAIRTKNEQSQPSFNASTVMTCSMGQAGSNRSIPSSSR